MQLPTTTSTYTVLDTLQWLTLSPRISQKTMRHTPDETKLAINGSFS